MKIAILGFGDQGESAFRYFSADPENEITLCRRKTGADTPDGAKLKLGADRMKNLDQFDLIVRTPSVHPQEIVGANGQEILRKVTTNTNEFFRVCPSKNIIGVTGTKGKGTTSALIAKMLGAAFQQDSKHSGKKVHLGGNIGTPPLDMLDDIKPDDWVVLELANFQLIDLKYSPRIGVCLMVEPEHMDWHEDMEEYIATKSQMFVHQNSDAVAVYYAKNKHSKEVASAGQGKKIPYYAPPGAIIENDDVVIGGQSICSTDEIKLLGQHNWQNVCAAVTAVWQVTQDVDAISSAITGFAGLEHRLEFVREVDGVKYYNDSFGTTPETAIVAIEAFNEPKVVILGGSDKGASFEELAEIVSDANIRQIILIGNPKNPKFESAAPKIAEALKNRGIKNVTSLVKPGGTTMDEIIKIAIKIAIKGDVVLLSAATASFDMFENYKVRGEEFREVVNKLREIKR